MNPDNLPKISIITPSFNQGKYLERTIISVLNQKYPNLEYIILDGGSTDDSVKIIKKYQKHLKYWHSKKDKGQSDAIQKGLNMATGDILCWLNSDDILLPTSLQFIGKIFTDYPNIEWLTSQSVIINDQDQIVSTGLHFGKSRTFLKLGLYHGKCLGFIPQEGTFWRRSLWKKSGSTIPQKKYCMDFSLWKKFAKFSPLVNLEAPLAAFRLQPNQKTATHFPYYYEISPFLAYLPRFTRIIGRIFQPFSRRLYPRITFNRHNYKWEYHK